MSGNCLAERRTRIVVQFKEVPHSIFRNIISGPISANRLVFDIQPEEKISLIFQAKNPGTSLCLRSVRMECSYNAGQTRRLDAYEKVLLDCLNGDQMLALRQDSEELCWSFLTPVVEDCEQCASREQLMHFYEAGSWGPGAAAGVRTP